MSMETVKALYYKENNIGNWLKKSKKQYVWKLEVDKETHHIEFMDSVLSGKKKIIKNGMVVFERQLFGVPFQYPFTIGKHSLNIAMHGDKYELRVDGMSFSHLYNLTKTQQTSKGDSNEEDDVGAAYDDEYNGGGYQNKSKKYDDTYDDYGPSSKPSQNDKDGFDWSGGSKPASSKFEAKSKPKEVDEDEEFDDTGYDGWNDVKRSGTAHKDIPDPYEKSKKYDPYPEDDVFGDKKSETTRVKAATIVGKNNDFFSGGFDQPLKQTKKNFDESSQPKTFDFNEFGKALPKKGQKDGFEDVFTEVPASKLGDDPFAWDGNNKAKKSNKEQFGNGFDFDFDNQEPKAKAPEKKGDVADFLDSHQEDKVTNDFDSFVQDSHNMTSTDTTSALAGITFDVSPAPIPQVFDSEPVIQTENEPDIKIEEEQNKRDPDELMSHKKLFDLSKLKKDTTSKLEFHNEQNKANGNFNNNGIGQGFSSNFDHSGFGGPMGGNFGTPQKVPETKEEKINAIESAFGSTQDPVVNQHPVAAPVQQPMNTRVQNSNNDFGEFPTMFGSNPDGFGTFKGFDEDAFGSQPSNQNTKQNNSDPFVAPVQPKQVKKDDWFEF